MYQERRNKEQTPASTANATEVQQKKRERTETKMLVRSRISTAIKRATMLVPAPNPQKTSVGLGKLRAGD